MTDVAIRQTAVHAAPTDYTIPGAQEILPKSVSASMDGTGAASPFFPCLQVLDPSGAVMFSAISTTIVAAGASADVSWFPGLSGAGASGKLTALGLTAFEQAGGFLTITSTDFNNPTNIVTSGSFVADGVTTCRIDFCVAAVDIQVTGGGLGTSLNLQLIRNTTNLGIICNYNVVPSLNVYGSTPVGVQAFDTPPAGTTTYSIAGVKGLTGGATATMRVFGDNAGSPFNTITHPGYVAVYEVVAA